MPSIAGVYLIRCDQDDRVYVGSSKNVHHRWKTHIWQLKHKTHGNANLQEIADTHGIDCLHLEFLEECQEADLRKREQHHLDLFMKDQGGVFNISHYTDCSMRGRSGELNPFFGQSHTEETKAVLRAMKLGSKHSEETKRKISELTAGKPRLYMAGKAWIKVKCVETGEIFESVSHAARAHGRENPSSLFDVLAGRQKRAYGLHWEAIEAKDPVDV